MEVFSIRNRLMDEFKKNRIDLTTLSNETFKSLKELNILTSQFSPIATEEELYTKYLYFLCRLERRANFEYRLIKGGVSNEESFKRVGKHLFDEMSLVSLELIKRNQEKKTPIEELAIGPNGIVVVLLKNSPIGRVYISRSSFIEAKLDRRPDRKIGHPYLKAIFSFI